MQIKEKVIIREKDSANVRATKFVATMKWKAPVDLDLHVIYMDNEGREGSVFYANRGTATAYARPFITLDRDAGIGDRGGDNKETVVIHNPGAHRHILIAANIFAKPGANFASYDGYVEVAYEDGTSYEVRLSSQDGGNWCVIAHFDNSGTTPKLHNVNLTTDKTPNVMAFLDGQLKPRKEGFFDKLSKWLG